MLFDMRFIVFLSLIKDLRQNRTNRQIQNYMQIEKTCSLCM